MLARIWRKRNTPPLLVGLQACTTILEICCAQPQPARRHNMVRFFSTAFIAGTPRCCYGDPGYPGRSAYILSSTGKGFVSSWDRLNRCHLISMYSQPPSTHSRPCHLTRHAASANLGGKGCLLYTSPSPRDLSTSRMPSSA